MKPQAAFLVFFLILSASVAAGIDSLVCTRQRVQLDVNHALSLTLRLCEPDRIDADTIRVYRSFIAMDAVRDTAYLSFAVSDKNRCPVLTANTGLTLTRLWSLSDQRASGALAALAALWLTLCLYWNRRRCEMMGNTLSMSALTYDATQHRFFANGREVHFTPMQRSLMEMFWSAPHHQLTHQDICDHLWPKKPDASATLYTLIRRLKPILHDATGITIECQRGESYQLKS